MRLLSLIYAAKALHKEKERLQMELCSGTYTVSNGIVYEGHFEARNQGRGTITYRNNNKYDGQWKDCQKHGTGTWTKAGKTWEQLWDHDKLVSSQVIE